MFTDISIHIVILPAAAIVLIALKLSAHYSRKKRREIIKKMILDRKEPESLSQAEDYEDSIKYYGRDDRVLLAWGEFLLFQYYRKNFAGDIPLIKRAISYGESIREKYSDMSFYGDAVFELGNIYFFITYDMSNAVEVYSDLIEEQPDTRWQSICRDRIELINDSIFNEMALKLYVTAEKYFEEGKYRQAQEYLKDVIKTYPGTGLTASSLYFLGDINYYKYSDLDAALEYYRKTVDGFPGHSAGRQALYKYGEILMKQSKWEEAISAFREYVKKFKDSPVRDDAYFFIGECYRKMGEFRKAKNAFSLILGDFPEGKWTDVIYNKVQEINKILKERKDE